MVIGAGALLAFSLCPWLRESVYTDPATNVTDYRSLFILPCLISLGAAVVLALFFRPPKIQESSTEAPASTS
jgi:hypothetical protein